MDNTIICEGCGKRIEVSRALQGQIEQQILAAEHERHQLELKQRLDEERASASKALQAHEEMSRQQLAGERDMLRKQTEAELEMKLKQLESEAASSQRKAAVQQDLLIRQLREDAEGGKDAQKELELSNKKLRDQLSDLMTSLRNEKQARENAELDAQKRLDAEATKIRDDATKLADERQRLNIAAKEKQLQDALKVNEELQRKLQQGSQQMQGEVMELDLEEALKAAFRDDELVPVAKGVNGADISQLVRNSRGSDCGTILWEIKRTKNWTDGWIPKLKSDLRAAKANIPVIVTQAMPKGFDSEMGQLDGVWICKPDLAIVLAMLLRRPLLDVAAQKSLAENSGDKATALYNYITSHEFVQQIESMVETYQEMSLQVQKERVAYEKLWSQRDKQARKLLLSTATVIGGMQGYIGQAAMPRIKGLELDSGPDDDQSEPLSLL